MGNKLFIFKKILLLSAIFFAITNAIILGMSWDEPFHYENGIVRLRYLFSLGEYKNYDIWFNIKYYPGLYDVISSFISQMFPKKFFVETHHLINFVFAISTIFCSYKITSKLFDKFTGTILFILIFTNPIFFGHMSINPKDTILAFCFVYTLYFALKYIDNFKNDEKRSRYTYLVALVVGLGSGTRAVFIISLLPICVFVIYKIYYSTWKNESKAKFYADVLKIAFLAYLLMIIAWPQTHQNIAYLPFMFIWESLTTAPVGTDWGLLNGKYYQANDTPKNYLLLNFIYKFPEFILLSIPLFFIFYRKIYSFFSSKSVNFKENLIFILFIIFYPITIIIFLGTKLQDGLRYFLYIVPFILIIPSILYSYLLQNINRTIYKIILIPILILFIFYINIFFRLNPYQYVYLNSFIGKFENSHTKFENDYWGLSLKELIKKIDNKTLNTNKKIPKIAFCGFNYDIAKYYLDKNNIIYQHVFMDKEFDYIIVTNRQNVRKINDNFILETCFETFNLKEVASVKRNGLKLVKLLRK